MMKRLLNMLLNSGIHKLKQKKRYVWQMIMIQKKRNVLMIQQKKSTFWQVSIYGIHIDMSHIGKLFKVKRWETSTLQAIDFKLRRLALHEDYNKSTYDHVAKQLLGFGELLRKR